jgi:hypothetical protein
MAPTHLERRVNMTSHELADEGFDTWYAFSLQTEQQVLEALPDDATGVYVIRDKRKFGRYRGESDIVYVGCAPKQDLKKRISLYFRGHETQLTNKRIHDRLKLIDSLEISCLPCAGAKAESIERELLRRYEDAHLELPPFNEQRGRT